MSKSLVLLLSIFSNTAYSQYADTVKVYQNDTSVFNQSVSWIQRPCQKPEWHVDYEMKKPKDGTYYLIYNDKEQMVEEGMYTSRYFIESNPYSGFYNSKYYYYKKNGKLSRVYHQIDGRNAKVEYYKRGKLRETRELH